MNVAVISGASSTPALSNAVVDRITQGWKRLDHILVAISPGNRAPRGRSVVEAILSYVGQPVRVFREGRWQEAPGWSLNEELSFPQIGTRPVALCETPDLDLLVERHKPKIAAEFKAGLELRLLHYGLLLLSRLVGVGLIRSLKPAAPVLHWLATRLKPLGTDCGGMVVRVSGLDGESKPCEARWWLAAKTGLGPNIPVLPAIAIVEGLASGSLKFRGAGAAAGLVSLDAVTVHLQRLGIETGTDVQEIAGPDLFEAAIGEAWCHLPEITRLIHTVRPSIVLEGRANVDGAETAAGRFIAALFGFPVASQDVPVRVVIERDGLGERWARHYPTRTMRSIMTAADPRRHTVEEHMGPFRFRLKLAASEAGIDLIPEAVSWRGLPLPRWCLPRIVATERASSANKHLFDVMLSLWPFGRLVHYRGWLGVA